MVGRCDVGRVVLPEGEERAAVAATLGGLRKVQHTVAVERGVGTVAGESDVDEPGERVPLHVFGMC